MDYSLCRLFTLLVVMLQSVLLFAGCAQEEPPQEPVIRPVWAIRLANLSNVSTRTFPGRAKASKEINMSFRVIHWHPAR